MNIKHRLTVMTENVTFGNTIVLPNALTFEKDRIAVYWNGDAYRHIGWAYDVEREVVDHEVRITMMIELMEGMWLDLEDCIEAFVYAQLLESRVERHPLEKILPKAEPITIVTNGVIRAIHLRDK